MLRAGGILLGIGLGGSAEGILLHQLLQWHLMLSTAVPPTTVEAMRTNLRADGFLSMAMWGTTVLGIWMLWEAGQRVTAFPSATWFIGQFFIGWGSFNFVEGVINHLVLDIHHVRMRPDFDWDTGFLLFAGIGFFFFGRWLARRGENVRR